MKKKNLKKLTLNRDSVSNLSVTNIKGGADSVLGVNSGCPDDDICAAHPPKEASIWSCKNQCWSWFTCPNTWNC